MIPVGKILGPHGIKGALRIYPYSELFEEYAKKDLIYIDENCALSLTITGYAKEVLLAFIQGVRDRNSASAYQGKKLYVQKSNLPSLEADHFYLHDLENLSVYVNETCVGHIAKIDNYGAGDILTIQPEGCATPILMPFKKAYVLEVDLKNQKIVVDPEVFEGFRSLNA